tara:strand:+ start:601 stop:1533 length:933 start_codon:yes stop_codon:yes gene_type:complete
MKKKSLNEIKLSNNVKLALKSINDKLMTQKKVLRFQGDQLEMTGPIMDYVDKLSDQEKVMLIDVIKSLTLLTSGNVKSVRSSGRTYDKKKAQSWEKVLSGISFEILQYMGFDVNQKVTERDYKDAARYLRSLTSQRNFSEDPLEKFNLIFRGMHGIDKNTLIYLLLNDELFIPQGSSFSTDFSESYSFAQGQMYNTLFVAYNPRLKGLDARGLSKYFGEDEIIFSGKIKLNKILIFNDYGSNLESEWEDSVGRADFVINPKESVFKQGGFKKQLVDLLTDEGDTYDWNMGIPFANGEMKRPFFVFVGKVI